MGSISWAEIQHQILQIFQPLLRLIWNYPDLFTGFGAALILGFGILLYWVWKREKEKEEELPVSSIGRWAKKETKAKTSTGPLKRKREFEELPPTIVEDMMVPSEPVAPRTTGATAKSTGALRRPPEISKSTQPIVTDQTRQEMDSLISSYVPETPRRPGVSPEVNREALEESGVLEGLAAMMVSPVSTEEEKGLRYSKMSIEGSLIFDETEEEGKNPK